MAATLKNRTRFLREVVQGIRSIAPGTSYRGAVFCVRQCAVPSRSRAIVQRKARAGNS